MKSYQVCETFWFFYREAGFSHDSSCQTPEEGRAEGAHLLAMAEREAEHSGDTFYWHEDEETDSSDFLDELPTRQLWVCGMQNAMGETVQSVHGIDFGRDSGPWGQPYKRVVEAELAMEEVL